MNINFKKMQKTHTKNILDMMRVFYASDALYTNGSEEIFKSNINNAVNDNPYLEGYTIFSEDEIIGYTMLAKSFSTEFGKECIWLEDLYLMEEYRGKGIIPKFIDFVKEKYPNKLLRLEVEKENSHAVHVYEKNGFKILPYSEYYFEN